MSAKSKFFKVKLAGLALFLSWLVLSPLFSAKALAATPYGPSDQMGPGTNDTFLNVPFSTALDSVHHRLFVSDTTANRVLIYDLDSQNQLLDHVADNVLGQTDLNGTNPGAGHAGFNHTAGVAYDAIDNRLFVADQGNGRVLVFDLSGGVIDGMDASHELGEPDFDTAPSGSLDQSSINSNVMGLVYDADQSRLFVADWGNNRVLVFDLSGGITDGMDASNVLGQPDFSTENFYSDAFGFDGPTGLAYDPSLKMLMVGDGPQDRVMVFDLSLGIIDGMPATHVVGQPDLNTLNSDGATRHSFGFVWGLIYDPSQHLLFVNDSDDGRVIGFDMSSVSDGEDAFAVLDQADFTTTNTDCSADGTLFCNPAGIDDAYDSKERRLFVSDEWGKVFVFNFVHLTGTTVPDGTLGASYASTIPVSGSQGAPNFSLSSGALPPGLSLNSSTGVINGTPTAVGSYSFTVTVTDTNGDGGTYSDSRSYSMAITKPVPQTATPTSPPATPNGFYDLGNTISAIDNANGTASQNESNVTNPTTAPTPAGNPAQPRTLYIALIVAALLGLSGPIIVKLKHFKP